MKPEKKAYKTPDLTLYGNIRDITKGSSAGTITDAAFPMGTQFNEITFS